MKTLWNEMSIKVNNQKILTDKLIIDMAKEKYRNKFNRILTYEGIGAIVLFIAAIILILKFKNLDTWYLIGCGIFTLIYLIVMPILILKSIIRIKTINIAKNNYKQTLIEFTKRKKEFLFFQQIGIFANFLLMIISLPVIVKLMNGKDLLEGSNMWYWYVPAMGIFLLLFSKWGYGCYKRIVSSAENIMKELDT